MGYDPVTVDQLVERTGAAPESITAELVTLELAGRIAPLPGGYWQTLATRKRSR
jgi:DNA processing protein